MRVLKRGSAILVAGAGNREVARCEGGDISWHLNNLFFYNMLSMLNDLITSYNCM